MTVGYVHIYAQIGKARNILTWSGNSLSWYGNKEGTVNITDARLQLNESGVRYYYAAIG